MEFSGKVVVFTDIHIDVEPSENAPNPQDRLKAGIAHAMESQADADCVVITGDLTHKGDLASYKKLRDLLRPLNLPIYLMVGNHDNRENFLQVFSKTPVDENGFVQTVIELPETRLILLDTLDGPPYDYPASHAGKLCEQRLQWLEHALNESANPCLILMHHPPMKSGFAVMDDIMLRDSDAFYQVVERCGGVHHLICGHIHRTISGTHRGLSYSMFKSFVGQMPMHFAAPNTQVEVNEPPAYGVLLLTPEGVVAHSEDFLFGEEVRAYCS